MEWAQAEAQMSRASGLLARGVVRFGINPILVLEIGPLEWSAWEVLVQFHPSSAGGRVIPGRVSEATKRVWSKVQLLYLLCLLLDCLSS